MGTVIYGGLTLREDQILYDSGIRIENGFIAGIKPNHQLYCEKGDEVFDCRDQMLLPGFINGHEHMYGVFSHGIPAGKETDQFEDFLTDFWWPSVEDRMDHRLIEVAAAWACIEMIDSGITAFADILEGPFSIPGALEAEKRIVEKAGLRALLSFEACERISQSNGEQGILENTSFSDACSESDLIKGMSSIHTLFTCSPEFVRKAKQMADTHHSLFHMHLSESDYEPQWVRKEYGLTPVEVYEEWGILDQNVLASQVVAVSDKEIDILARHHVHVVSMPISNCEVVRGFAPLDKMLRACMQVALGTAGYINNFFEVMRAAFLVHKANNKSPAVMPAKSVYKMATSMGSSACGFQSGILEVGRPADLITVKLDTPTPVVPENLYDQIILYRNPQDVVNVFVQGKCLKKHGEIVSLNKQKCLSDLRHATTEFWKKGG